MAEIGCARRVYDVTRIWDVPETFQDEAGNPKPVPKWEGAEEMGGGEEKEFVVDRRLLTCDLSTIRGDFAFYFPRNQTHEAARLVHSVLIFCIFFSLVL